MHAIKNFVRRIVREVLCEEEERRALNESLMQRLGRDGYVCIRTGSF